jgi:hypothetical protein
MDRIAVRIETQGDEWTVFQDLRKKRSGHRWELILPGSGMNAERPQGEEISGHFSGQSLQASANTSRHYLDERDSKDRTSEHESTLTGPTNTNSADLQNQCAGESRWAGSIPVRLRK